MVISVVKCELLSLRVNWTWNKDENEAAQQNIKEQVRLGFNLSDSWEAADVIKSQILVRRSFSTWIYWNPLWLVGRHVLSGGSAVGWQKLQYCVSISINLHFHTSRYSFQALTVVIGFLIPFRHKCFQVSNYEFSGTCCARRKIKALSAFFQ